MKRNYDAIVGVYDLLARIFIGSALRDAQIALLQYIPSGAKVLVAGGGTGWILEEITKIHSSGLQIDYLDISTKMIIKAKQRNVKQNVVCFLNQSAEAAFAGSNYDVIVTPFFFDNFKEVTVHSIFTKLDQKLKAGGIWLYADFQVAGKHQLFQKSMLNIMYTFFRVACNIEADHLPDIEELYIKQRYQLINQQSFKHQFIISSVYKKAGY